MQLAAELQRFVKEQKLTVNIKGKSYPLVESWQFAGSQLGLIPIIQSVQNISTDSEVKYSATVEVIRIADGCVVSRGFAICSNKEGNKRTWDEYAICSMAQTRATGKAFRNILGWLMKAAGFAATPAEEMDFSKEPDGPTEDERKILKGCKKEIDELNKYLKSDIMTSDKIEPLPNKEKEFQNAYKEFISCSFYPTMIMNNYFNIESYLVILNQKQIKYCKEDCISKSKKDLNVAKSCVKECIDYSFNYSRKATYELIETALQNAENEIKRIDYNNMDI